jgi:hypothetical protein
MISNPVLHLIHGKVLEHIKMMAEGAISSKSPDDPADL